MKYYNWNSVFDFGQYDGKTLKEVFDDSPDYIVWCFKKVQWFCISDEIYNSLSFVLPSKIPIDKSLEEFAKEFIDDLRNLHDYKKIKLKDFRPNQNYDFQQNSNVDCNNWLEEASGTNDPETMNDVYWNLD